MEVCKLHGCPDLRLVGVMFLQVPGQRAIVAATVRAVLPPAHCGTTGAADVYVNVIVDVGGGGSYGAYCRLGLGSDRGRNRCWLGKGGARAPRSSSRCRCALLL